MAGERDVLPDEADITEWPGGGGRASQHPLPPDWMPDPDGAWVVLYAPRQFYDGLRRKPEPAAAPPLGHDVLAMAFAAPSPEPLPLDVERLARALCASRYPTLKATIETFVDDECRSLASAIARQYAALREPDRPT